MAHVFWPLLVVYLMASVGSIGGGGLSSWLIHRGASINVARKTALLLCALGVVPVVTVSRLSSMWVAVLLIGLAAPATPASPPICSRLFPTRSPARRSVRWWGSAGPPDAWGWLSSPR